MTAKYSQWATLSLLALLISGMLFAPVRAQAARAAEKIPAAQLGVADLHYDLASAHLAAVEFSVTAPAPAGLQVRLTARGTWYPCSVHGASVVCATPDRPAFTDVDRLEVEAR